MLRTVAGALQPRFARAGSAIRVIVTEGPDLGGELLVGATPMTIGTSAKASLVLTDPMVSRTHAEVWCVAGALEVKDLGSKNGIYVSDCRVHAARVACGAELRLGGTTLKVQADDEAVEPAPSPLDRFGKMVGSAHVSRQLFTLIEQVARTEATVLIEGETGAGKELVAEEIHANSPRAQGPFVVFDCGSVPETLVEATLFGHVRGAFTGAVSDQAGLFAQAHGGTIFLDEIGELDLELQPALLRALDRRMIRPVGSTTYRAVDVRVIAATHRNLARRVEEERFREDLYYRLAVVRLTVPALRERLDDLVPLIEHLAKRRVTLAPGELERLRAHTWPGNVRELRNAVEGALALGNPDALTFGNLGRGAPSQGSTKPSGRAEAGEAVAEVGLYRDAKAQAIEAFDQAYFRALMSRHESVGAAAEAAGMDRKHLRLLLRRYGLRDA